MAKRIRSELKLFVLFMVAIIAALSSVQCQDEADFSNPAVLQLFTQILYSRITNLTILISGEFSRQSKSCIKNPKADWDQAFNFSSDLGFLASCIQTTRGDVTRRVCTAAEVKFYFRSFFESGSVGTNYLQPNKNCNLSSWASGCEPGWACGVSQNQKIDMKDSQDMPVRIHDCQACCEGFFCPHGITCMIPCPLGSYCPVATLNKTTGECEPYNYQLPPGKINHTCGGANTWADVGSNSELFCSAGSYCPTTIKKFPCSSGHYCKMGSTTEKRCFKLTSCSLNTANQNMRAYGIMVIVALSTLLLIIYNCSDQVLMSRARREAKTREAAARSARERTRAQKRWNLVKDATKKRASNLQSQISSKFYRKTHAMKSEELKILDQSISGPSVEYRETDQFMKLMGLCEDDSGSSDSSRMKDGDINVRTNLPMGKEMHTDSQVFKYAYGQIEKEKALEQQNKNLTFSGLVSVAANMEIRKRPVIELIFMDLTLTLKGKNKKLLRCVTGKIKPGHITAVMGPSGAGKTTFLSILAGKPTGCNLTGQILINGKNDSIHSYKKIVGFVPQDDIVHGNLTVEENLWFSAKCRLPKDMALPEKVLIVERVIESLGLDAVRGSVVGTVEKRGISGGQRKRVNVGLEMVMEPSLLFLDEPTSGLDSSSSHLLLRALRHETLEGVNICMVVHQPSYAVYQMFDDLILLAEGGFTVYHGPVNKAQEYFASLGVNVPEHVNPPDLFIDVLEGIVKPRLGSGVNYKELPIHWMIRNGYSIPLDMQQCHAHFSLPAMDQNSRRRSSSDTPNGVLTRLQTVVGVLWQDIKFIVELKRENVRHNFLRFKDLSNRETPGVLQQYRLFLGRVGKQRLREARMQAVDYLILLLAGTCLGSIIKVSDQSFGAPAYTYTIIAVSLLCKIAALRSFSLDKLQSWRESASGMSTLAHFLSKDTIDLFNMVIKPLVYLSMFYFFSNPRSTFADNYIVLFCLVYCVTGIAYALAIFFEPGPAQLWSVLLPVILTLVATQPRESKILKILANFCYPKWGLEAFVVSNAERYYGVWLITRCGSLLKSGYSLHRWSLCIFKLIIAGVVSRAIAFFGMVTFQRR